MKTLRIPWQQWAGVCMLYLLLIMVLGVVLRAVFVFPDVFTFNYTYILHTHSHMAFLGWVFNALFLLIVHQYGLARNRWVKLQFVLFQGTLLGMLFSFPFQGYGAFSITFSTLHIVFSFWFLMITLRHAHRSHYSFKWIGFAFFFMVLSSLGPFALGPLAANGMKNTLWYTLAIQFYLHFFYNGCFVIALLGLLPKVFKITLGPQERRLEKRAYSLMTLSVLLTFSLVLLVYTPAGIYRYLGSLGAFMQLMGIFYFFRTFLSVKMLARLSPAVRLLLLMALFSLVVKGVFQLLLSFPFFTEMVTGNRHAVIGFLHLVFIGFVSPLILVCFIRLGWLPLGPFSFPGFLMFLVGFIMTEIMLFCGAEILHTGFYTLMLYASLFLLIGAVLFSVSFFLVGITDI